MEMGRFSPVNLLNSTATIKHLIFNIYIRYLHLPIRDDKGEIVQVICVRRDITDRVYMEDQLKHSHEMKIFGQLAAGVAHEVRNPLNAILAITEALFQDIGENL